MQIQQSILEFTIYGITKILISSNIREASKALKVNDTIYIGVVHVGNPDVFTYSGWWLRASIFRKL